MLLLLRHYFCRSIPKYLVAGLRPLLVNKVISQENCQMQSRGEQTVNQIYHYLENRCIQEKQWAKEHTEGNVIT